jgi:5-methylthioadenosine/S-adenosylhomocysteine deaminase
MTKPILIRGGILLSMLDEAVPYEGDLLIEGDQITCIGDRSHFTSLPDGMDEIDATGCVVMPGLINTHTHTPMTIMRSTSDNLGSPSPDRKPSIPPGQDWRSDLTPEDIYRSSFLAIAEMIRTGTTTFVDMYHDMDQVARAVIESGIRAALGWEILTFRVDPDEWLPYEEEIAKRTFEECARFASNWHGKGDGRVMALIAPHETSTCHEPWLSRSAKLAGELGLGITLHLSEGKMEVEYCAERYELSPVEVAERAGILEHHVIGAHSLYLTDQDIQILGGADYSAAACLGAYIKVGKAVTPVPQLLRAGINVGMGTDSAETNNNLNLWDEIALNATLHGFLAQDQGLIPANEALQMATVYGARALGMEDQLGTLEVGKKADLIIVDIDQPHLRPWEGALIGNLVYASSGHDVRDVIIDGKLIMRDRVFVTFDEHEIVQRAEESVRKLRERFGLPHRYHSP